MSYLHLQMRPSVRRSEITILSFTKPLPGPLSQWKHYETLYCTQTGGDDLLFTSMIDLLLSLSLSIVRSRRIFFFRYLNILCLWWNRYCANKGTFLSLSFKIITCARQDLYDGKQCCFCPQALLQSTQNQSPLVWL